MESESVMAVALVPKLAVHNEGVDDRLSPSGRAMPDAIRDTGCFINRVEGIVKETSLCGILHLYCIIHVTRIDRNSRSGSRSSARTAVREPYPSAVGCVNRSLLSQCSIIALVNWSFPPGRPVKRLRSSPPGSPSKIPPTFIEIDSLC